MQADLLRTTHLRDQLGVHLATNEPLTSREADVLQLLAAGLSNAEIAHRLIISTATVKTHTRNIYRKLGVSNRTQAAVLGLALNLSHAA